MLCDISSNPRTPQSVTYYLNDPVDFGSYCLLGAGKINQRAGSGAYYLPKNCKKGIIFSKTYWGQGPCVLWLFKFFYSCKNLMILIFNLNLKRIFFFYKYFSTKYILIHINHKILNTYSFGYLSIYMCGY